MDETYIVILLGMVLSLLLVGILLILLFVYQRRAHGLKARLDEMKSQHAREIESARREIVEQTLEEVSREIHDNIGQRLSLLKLMINGLLEEPTDEPNHQLIDIAKLTSKILSDFKGLAKQIKSSGVEDIKLPEAVQDELNRLKKSNIISSRLIVEGIPKKIGSKENIFIFRMFQESLNNIIAHANATQCNVILDYGDNSLRITMSDNGKGFKYHNDEGSPKIFSGMGLENIRKRSLLIGATCEINSTPGEGTSVIINAPYGRIKKNNEK